MTGWEYVGALGILSVSGFIGGAVISWLCPAGKAARQFRLVDEEGRARLIFRGETDMPAMVLSDTAGRPRVMLNLSETGAGLGFLDTSGNLKLDLSVVNGNPAVSLYDATEQLRGSLRLISEGEPNLGFLDAAGHLIWKAR